MYRWLSRLLRWCWPWLQWLVLWPRRPVLRRGSYGHEQAVLSRRIFAPPKPKWVRTEVIRLKALMPEAGCRMIAHTFNRTWRTRRDMTVSKTYVADTCRKEQYRILQARRQLKHRVPCPMPRNRVWGCDLLTKTDAEGRRHLALAILDHASRACGCKPSRTSHRCGCGRNFYKPYSAMADRTTSGRTMKPCSSPGSSDSDCGYSVFASNAFSLAVLGKTGEWNGSLGRSSERWRWGRSRTKQISARHCETSAPGTTTSGRTITCRGEPRRRCGPASMCLRRSQASAEGHGVRSKDEG